MTETSLILTTSQAARELGLSKQHVIRLATDRKLAHYTTPLGRLFKIEDVRQLADERAAAQR